MKLKNFQIYSNSVELFMQDGTVKRLLFNDLTGKIMFRYKIDTISKVKHPGIVLGCDEDGVRYYMHNHHEAGRPVIDTEERFAKGQKLYISDRQSQLGNLGIIQNGLSEVMQGKLYNRFNYNCQTFVNRICFNESRSEAVENWAGGILVCLLFVVGISALNNSK